MPRNHFVYKDKEVKRFNHVTVVKGEAKIKESTVSELTELENKIQLISCELWARPEVTGRAKCSPEDTFNEKTGLIVASRKAELKAAKLYLKTVDELIVLTERYLELLRSMEDNIDYKTGKLTLDLFVRGK